MSKTGIIYCPYHKPFTSVQKRWEKIKACLDKHGISYDMVQSEERQSVERLVMMMINNSYDNIIIAGGDSALNEAVNCFMRVEKHIRDNVALGIIPNGTMNDFSRVWGFTYDNIENSVSAIAGRRIKKIDIGCIRYKNSKGENKQRYFINCINIGLLASIQNMREKVRKFLWSRRITYAATMILVMLKKKDYKIKYKINGNTEKHKIATLCIGNAHGYGLTPNATPYNGMLDVMVIKHTFLSQFLTAFYLFARKKIMNYKYIIPYRTEEAEIYTSNKLPLSIDGQSKESPSGGYSVKIVPEELNFIVENYKH